MNETQTAPAKAATRNNCRIRRVRALTTLGFYSTGGNEV
jgi:hypothetical protein